MEALIKILDELQEKYQSRDITLMLCGPNVTDYERGKIQGEINMLTKINMMLSDNEAS